MKPFKDREIKRIRIIGGAGSGKTTLAKELATSLDYPIISLDHIAKKVKGLEEEAGNQFIKNIIKEDYWIIEGVQGTGPFYQSLEAADLILFLDYSLRRRKKYLLKRYASLKFKQTDSNRRCTAKQLIHLMKWNEQFDARKKGLLRKINTLEALVIQIDHPQKLKEILVELETYMISRKESNTMDLTKLNFFNKKEGEKYKYEYNYDDEYDYDYDYEYDYEDIIPSKQVSESLITPSIPEITATETKDSVSSHLGVDEVAQLRKETKEQKDYIQKLMLIKQKSDDALIQLRDTIEDQKEISASLRQELEKSEAEKEELKKQLTQSEIPTPAEPQTTTKEGFETELLVKHIKLSQAQTKKLEDRLANMEAEIKQLKTTSLGTIKRKKVTRNEAI